MGASFSSPTAAASCSLTNTSLPFRLCSSAPSLPRFTSQTLLSPTAAAGDRGGWGGADTGVALASASILEAGVMENRTGLRGQLDSQKGRLCPEAAG